MLSDKMLHYERTTEFGKICNERKKHNPECDCIEERLYKYWGKALDVEILFEEIFKWYESGEAEIWSKDINNGEKYIIDYPHIKKWKSDLNSLMLDIEGHTQYSNQVTLNMSNKSTGVPLSKVDIETKIKTIDNIHSQSVDMAIAMLGFWIAGKRVFKVTEGLCYALLDTDIENKSKIDHIVLPYPSIYLTLPKGQLKSLHVAANSHYIAEGVYLEIRKNTLIGNIVLRLPKSAMNYNNPPAMYILGEKFSKFQIQLDKNMSISEAIKSTGVEDCMDCKHGDDSAIIEIILKAVMYITSTNANINEVNINNNKKINKKKFLKFPYREKSRESYNIAGSDIKIDNKPASGVESTGTGKSLTTRFMVRGHYHHFWKIRTEEITDSMVVKTNEDGKVLIRKWIAPYWKGPEYGDVVLKNYKVTV